MTLSWVPVLRCWSIVMLEADPLNVVPMGQSYACDPGSILEVDLSLSLMVALGKHDYSQAPQSLGTVTGAPLMRRAFH